METRKMVDVECQKCKKKIQIPENSIMFGIMCSECINKSLIYEV